MITGVTVERFRGLARLDVDGFSRVNLIIGKNDCGKTALMEAVDVLSDGSDASDVAGVLRLHQARRLGSTDDNDLVRFWAPLFWRSDTKQGFALTARLENHTEARLRAREVILSEPRKTWEIEFKSSIPGFYENTAAIAPGPHRLEIRASNGRRSLWVRPATSVGETEIRNFSELRRAGRDSELVAVLLEIDDRVSGVELLAPSGTQAELYIRIGEGAPMLLPVALMGDGFQRCLEIAIALAATSWPTLFIDEFDNGLHYSTLAAVWRWVAKVAASRNVQVFATTHSEECIQAACQAFKDLDDDGLRVIRLDRHDENTTAAVYDRHLVEAAGESGVEIRG